MIKKIKLQRRKENKAMEWRVDQQHDVPKQKKILGHSRQDGWTEEGQRGSTGEWDMK